MQLRPTNGGFVRPFGAAWFVVEFLKGKQPEGSRRIDPSVGAPMVDVWVEYKDALRRAHARDRVEREEERRIRQGGAAYSEDEYDGRLGYHLDRTPFRTFKMRYASFTRYFGHLERLQWVEKSGCIEPSAIQDDYAPAPPRVFYRLTLAGWKAKPQEVSDPVMTLYHYSRAERSAKRRAYFRA